MLVLSRKNRKSVEIGGDDGFHRLLRVTVLDIRGAEIRQGFEVSSDVPVYRGEVWPHGVSKGANNREQGSSVSTAIDGTDAHSSRDSRSR